MLASRNIAGRPLGPFRYYGTRPRRSQRHRPPRTPPRAARPVRLRRLAESRRGQELELARQRRRCGQPANRPPPPARFRLDARQRQRQAQSRRAGNEFVWESRPTLITMLTLGLYVRPWIKVPYPDIPAVGRIESNYYRAETWKPDYPNPAFATRGPTIASGRRASSRLSTRRPSPPSSARRSSRIRSHGVLTKTLLERRSKVLTTWLNATNPVVDLALSEAGELTFANAATRAAVAKPAEKYTLRWARFDNTTATAHPAAASRPSSSRKLRRRRSCWRQSRTTSPWRCAGVPSRSPAWSQPLSAYSAGPATDGRSWASTGFRDRPRRARRSAQREGGAAGGRRARGGGAPLFAFKAAAKMPDFEVYWRAGARPCGRAALPRRRRTLPPQIPAGLRRALHPCRPAAADREQGGLVHVSVGLIPILIASACRSA